MTKFNQGDTIRVRRVTEEIVTVTYANGSDGWFGADFKGEHRHFTVTEPGKAVARGQEFEFELIRKAEPTAADDPIGTIRREKNCYDEGSRYVKVAENTWIGVHEENKVDSSFMTHSLPDAALVGTVVDGSVFATTPRQFADLSKVPEGVQEVKDVDGDTLVQTNHGRWVYVLIRGEEQGPIDLNSPAEGISSPLTTYAPFTEVR